MSESRAEASIEGYWSSFYARQGTSAPSDPSPFAQWVDDQLDSGAAILEVGCGNGRDARFFARQGRRVMAFDQSPEAIRLVMEAAKLDGLSNIQASAVPVSELSASATNFHHLRALLGDGAVAVYARFFLHAITPDEQADFLAWIQAFLHDGERCYLEYRAADLPDEQYEFGSHYRRPVATTELSAECKTLGFEVLSADESRDFAPYKDERPLVGRTVLRRRA